MSVQEQLDAIQTGQTQIKKKVDAISAVLLGDMKPDGPPGLCNRVATLEARRGGLIKGLWLLVAGLCGAAGNHIVRWLQ